MIDQTWYKRIPGVPDHTSAGGVVARLENEQIYIALLQENRNSEYVLPKGHVEAGETIEEAARREIEEEAGLSHLQLIAPLGVRERLAFSKRSWKITHYFLFITDQVEGSPTDPDNDYQLEWFPLAQLPSFFWPEQREIIETNRDRIGELLR
ncbi:MAG TPA: ADP-ribose pyrophosphatase [Cyanobacteria bacterium UBA9273]|nr:ADP-ribose pyrophosphatase [Cyanobacteria bacterium UBA9273]